MNRRLGVIGIRREVYSDFWDVASDTDVVSELPPRHRRHEHGIYGGLEFLWQRTKLSQDNDNDAPSPGSGPILIKQSERLHAVAPDLTPLRWAPSSVAMCCVYQQIRNDPRLLAASSPSSLRAS